MVHCTICDQCSVRMSGSDVEYGTWEQNRHSNLEILQQSDLFTDVRLRVEDETFQAHRYNP